MMSPQQSNMVIKYDKPLKVLVCGGRRYTNRAFMFEWLDLFALNNVITHVINGECGGADRIANEWAEDRGIQPVNVPALWRKFGSDAGPIRNRAMAALSPDLCIAFHGGNLTASMVSVARAAGISVIEIAELFKEAG